MNVGHKNYRVSGSHIGENCVILRAFLFTWYRLVTDRQTDGKSRSSTAQRDKNHTLIRLRYFCIFTSPSRQPARGCFACSCL